MVEGVMAKWGRIDTLVNNAGIVAGRAVEEDVATTSSTA